VSTDTSNIKEQREATARVSQCKLETVTIDKVLARPQLPFHPTVAGVTLDFDNSVGVQVGERLAFVIPSDGLFGPCSDLGDLLRKPRVWGVIINCFGEPWTVDSEPTVGNAFGLLVRNESGRCVMSGEGEVANASQVDGATRPTMRFSIKTVYANVGAQRRSVTVGGSGTNTGWEVHGSVTWQF
jgi:hypothetical protein